MATVATHGQLSLFSCHCLNIRIAPQHPQSTPPNPAIGPEFIQVYVGEEGINVIHPHITIRTRTRGIPIEGTSRCRRYTTLTCLICDVLAYRVFQVVPIDVDGKEGPLLPTDDWVEKEVMKSSTGWIEVSNQCLTGDAVNAIESSLHYSHLFSLVLPELPPLATAQATISDIAVVSAVTPPTPSEQVHYLDKLKPIFPPAPFTPSHPVFLHLASRASDRSEAIRASAEEYIAQVVKQKMAEVEQAEEELKNQVDALWFKFKASLEKHKGEKSKPTSRSFSPRVATDGTHDLPRSATIAVKEFVPVSVPPVRTISPSRVPQMSALSASLATTTFHHPKTVNDSRPMRVLINGSDSRSSSHSSERTGSATLVRSPPREGGSNVLQFPRNIDDHRNTAISFKYFMDLEEEIERKKRERLEEMNKKHRQVESQAGPSHRPSNAAVVNGEDRAQEKAQKDAEKQVQVDTEGSVVESGEKTPSKGKRKVTFDVEPAIVTIGRGAEKAKEEASSQSNHETRGDMIFELEDLEGEDSEQSSDPKQTLPLLEQPTMRPSRHRKARSLTNGLPASFSSLRPMSLPAPSHVRPPRTPHGVDASSQGVMFSLPRQSSIDHQRNLAPNKHTLSDVQDDKLNPRDAVILRLVAADTPSHRGAWKPDSEAWKSFVRPQAPRAQPSNPDITEEDESVAQQTLGSDKGYSHNSSDSLYDEDASDTYQHNNAGVPASLPMTIAPLIRKKEPLSLASYQPKTSLTDRPGTIVPALISRYPSAAALRRAAYAERDRIRAMDPGALDFATEDEEEEAESSEIETEEDQVEVYEGVRGRKRALKILQARSEIPEEGMWRSLAS
ncbi:hypothetical protein AMATHDRAFT_5063 [Amanita thiersii Skay4041]|uniref:Uncharacterized protein n=1 Tax=Amanita thiersii Skay4041 TaxID=703135 RepID=A0A2A9NNC4_9AGAR|nr:hypothetical protein AMATHDRAFT_5063 [Amanita thiersii Skay4041]